MVRPKNFTADDNILIEFVRIIHRLVFEFEFISENNWSVPVRRDAERLPLRPHMFHQVKHTRILNTFELRATQRLLFNVHADDQYPA